MKPSLVTLLCALWIGLPLAAEPRFQEFEERLKSSFLAEKEFETRLHPGPLEPTLGGDGERAMQLAERLYRLAGPKRGCMFVEACYLLCLGDQRPYASWNGLLEDPGPEDVEILERLNRTLMPHGYSLHVYGPDKDGEVAAFSIRSLAGLQLHSEISRLPWVPKYQRSTGWHGYYAWKTKIWRGFPDRSQGFDKVEGILLGYPDSAVEHYQEQCFADWPTTVKSYLPEAYTYVCGVPVFSLRFQDSLAADVVALEDRWRQFFREAYSSPAHLRLSQDPQFLAARRLRAQSSGIDGLFSEPRARGWTLANPSADLDSDLERWLAGNLEELVQAAGRTADLHLIAQQASHRRLTTFVLWKWLLRGSLGGDPLAQRWFEAFKKHHPEALFEHYRRQLKEYCQALLERKSEDPEWAGSALLQWARSAYLQQQLEHLSEDELDLLFQAIESRRDFPPLAELIAHAQDEGPFNAALNRLRKRWPQRWAPRP